MPVTRTVERNSLEFHEPAHKTYSVQTRFSRQYEESNGNSARSAQRRVSESAKKPIGSARYLQSTPTSAVSHTQISRRSSNDTAKQSPTNNEKSYNQRQPSPPTKPKCLLPTTVSQPGYVTPSKLFNIMGYGLQNQYLFMHSHYLYIIDCRSREKFNESHIITGKHFIECH